MKKIVAFPTLAWIRVAQVLSFLLILVAGVNTPTYLLGQSSTSSGAIQGTLTDQSGAVVPGATINIKNEGTSQVKTFVSDSSGYYNSGPLVPGSYTISITAAGFAPLRAPAVVQIGNVTNGGFKLAVGSQETVVEVQGSDVRVDTTQTQVQGVLTSQQIDNLPINGRNFLDLAQLEPGVQLQDGQDFDPTKAGYSSVSFNGIYGRTARIMLDGQDISDETVGTTTLNVTQGSIEEVQINRSSLDLSNEITSSGSVVVSTKTGTNSYHGEAFYNFRDQRAIAADGPGGTSYPFQRNQFGGRFGAPIIKDKLFFFGSSERIKQDALNSVQVGPPFSTLSGGYNGKFRDTYSAGRLDYNAPHGIHMFARIGYEANFLAATAGLGYSVYGTRNNTPAMAFGADFVTGSFTHSLRASYLKFHNEIVDDSSSAFNPVAGVQLDGPGGLFTGPNYLAPQQTYQSDKQYRYDGGWSHGAHQFRYGVSVNRILGGGLASFFGLAPLIELSGAPVAGLDPSNPANYPTGFAIFGNGNGFFTEKSGFGYPAGGQGDWRLGLYVGDSWKASPRMTFNLGVRYGRDTGRTDSDLAPLPCTVVSLPSYVPDGSSPCSSGNLLDSLAPGLGDRIHQPNLNFGPQGGFAWDVSGNGKTVIRAGMGIYFENSIFNNTLFDRPDKLASGLFNGENYLCGGITSFSLPGTGTPLTSIDGIPFTTLCAEPVSQSAPEFAKLQAQFQAATAAAGASANPSFIGSTLTNNNGDPFYSPKYVSPRSVQMNIGVQHELWQGGVITADYIRNVGTHFQQNIDVNHVGDARYLNLAAAQNAIGATLVEFDAPDIDGAIANGATIADFAGNGLDSGNQYLGGYPASIQLGAPPAFGAAFGGVNPLWGKMQFSYPLGRSVYNGLQTNFRQQKPHPFKGVTNSNFETSYSFSRFVSTGGADQFFTPGVYDQVNPTKYIGPSGLDRTHQLSLGGFFDVIGGAQVGLIGHFSSSLPTTLSLQADPNGAPGEIFRTDVTGDGTTGDLLPGVEPGAYMRDAKGDSINKIINRYNSTYANKITPAGNTLISAGLFTSSQLQALGATTQSIVNAPPHQKDNGLLRTFDLKLSYPIKLKKISETASLEPQISFFNVFNFANFGNVSGTLEAVPNSNPQTVFTSANTTPDFASRDSLRVGNGTGVFSQGTARTTEFGLKFDF